MLKLGSMKPAKLILPLAAIAMMLFSMCDYVTSPRDVEIIVPEFDTTKRIAIIEEWTGHTCIACPTAARRLDTLKSIYGERLVVISIHDDFFAEPCPPHPTPPCASTVVGAFAEDFRCPTGASYSAAHPDGPASPPKGMVNRLGIPSNTEVKDQGYWNGLVDSIVREDACASIHIDHVYNATNRNLSVTVRGTWLQAHSGTINVAVMLTESGMFGWQTDGPSNCDPNFEFKDVLRECLNTPGSITGTQLSTGTTAIGTAYSYSLPTAYTIPNAFNPANCHVVAIIYDTTTGEVLQAWEEDVQ